MSGKTREQQLDELLDKQAIYELIMAYCNAADRHDHVKMRTLYQGSQQNSEKIVR